MLSVILVYYTETIILIVNTYNSIWYHKHVTYVIIHDNFKASFIYTIDLQDMPIKCKVSTYIKVCHYTSVGNSYYNTIKSGF